MHYHIDMITHGTAFVDPVGGTGATCYCFLTVMPHGTFLFMFHVGFACLTGKTGQKQDRTVKQ